MGPMSSGTPARPCDGFGRNHSDGDLTRSEFFWAVDWSFPAPRAGRSMLQHPGLD